MSYEFRSYLYIHKHGTPLTFRETVSIAGCEIVLAQRVYRLRLGDKVHIVPYGYCWHIESCGIGQTFFPTGSFNDFKKSVLSGFGSTHDMKLL